MKLNTIQRIKARRGFEVAFREEELVNWMYHGFCYKPSIFRLPKMFGFDLRICLTDMMISIGNLRFLKHTSIADK